MDIVYDFFLECQSCTFDNFWRAKFSELARGIFPEGVSYQDGVMKANGVEYAIPKDKREAFVLVKDILKKVGIKKDTEVMSELLGTSDTLADKRDKTKLFLTYIESNLFDSRDTKAKTKGRKQGAKKDVSSEEEHPKGDRTKMITSVLNTLKLAFKYKAITQADVVYNDEGEIENIRGVKFTSKGTLAIPEFKVGIMSEKKNKNIRSFYKAIDRYCKDIGLDA